MRRKNSRIETAPHPPLSPGVIDEVRRQIRVRHYSFSTERTYVYWTRFFIRFHGLRDPREMGAPEVEAFLSYLATERKVSASTQNQAKAALLFLFKAVLGVELPWLGEIVSAQPSRRLPVVLTRREVKVLLENSRGTGWLIASLLYGTGLRVIEGLRLRVKDIDLERREITVREGKGGKDRVTMVPENLLRDQLGRAKRLHDRDLSEGYGAVNLPAASAAKYPNSSRSWGWQFVFPSQTRCVDPRTGEIVRRHWYPGSVQRALREAGRAAHNWPSRCIRMCSDIPLRPICFRMATTFARFRNAEQGRARRAESSRSDLTGAKADPTGRWFP